MRTELSLAEALSAMGLIGKGLPPFVTSVGGAGGELEVVADARQVKNLPGPVKLATKLVPAVRSKLRVESFDGGVAVLSLDANVAGLPAHKLLGLAAGHIEKVLAYRGVPAGSVQIRPDARIALDVQALLAAKQPGTVVTNLAFTDGRVALETAA